MGRQGLQSITSTKVSVLATSTLVLAANDNRERVTLTNDSNETMYLSFNGTGQTSAAVMNEGLPLFPGETVIDQFPNISYGAIYAICSSGAKNIAVTEGV